MLSACVCSTSCRRKQFGALREARAEAERIARRVQFSGVLAQHDVDVLSAICSLPTVTFKQDATRLPPGVTTDSGGDTDPFPASALEMQSTRPCHAPGGRNECAVCLGSFQEGDELRGLPCKHT